jgi:hypothetical protein
MKSPILTALLSAGLAAAAPQAFAQGAESPQPQVVAQAEGAGPQARQSARGQSHGKRAFRSPTDRAEARLAYLKTALKITGEQEAQWNAFADVQRKQAREAGERMEKFRAQRTEGQKRTPPTAIERMERRQAMMATVSTRLNETLAAAKPLYAALSPDQQKVADEVLASRGRGGHGQRGGHRGRG